MTTLATGPDVGSLPITLIDRPSLDEAVGSVRAAARRHRTVHRGGWVLLSGVSVLLTGLVMSAAPTLLVAVTVGWAGWSTLVSSTLALLTRVDLARRLGFLLVTGTAGVTVLDLGRAGLVDVVAMVGVGAALTVGWWARIRLNRPRTIVVGSSEAVQRAINEWQTRRDIVVVGAEVVGRDAGGRWLPCHRDPAPGAPWDSVVELVEECQADVVVCLADDGLVADDLRQLGWAMESTSARLVVSSAVAEAAPWRVSHRRLGGRTMTVVGSSAPATPVATLKSAFDRVGALLALVVLSPLLLVLAAAVRLDSDGPAVFRQVRVGHHGRLFTMLKFRTMCLDAEAVKLQLVDLNEGNAVLFKLRRDPRVTRIGRFLRRTSLDELPQLVNVLRGEMSLVGPRPALPSEVAGYDHVERRRLAVRPGLTGLWQVSGRSDLDWHESLRLDLDYADNISLARDLSICLSTVQAITTGRGAY